MAREPLNLAELLKDPVEHGGPSAAFGQTGQRGSGEVPGADVGSWKKHQNKIAAAFVGVVFAAGVWGVRSELELAVGSLFRSAVTNERPVPTPDLSKQASRPQQASEATLQRTETAPSRQAVSAAQQANPDLGAFSKPVQELMHYLEGLKRGRFSFNWGITGEEAAKQLGFTRLFASAYEEMLLHVKSLTTAGRAVSIDHVILAFESIVREEQKVDKLMSARDQPLVVSIAYLRALQNGDVVFPALSENPPTQEALLAMLRKIEPKVVANSNDPFFAQFFLETRRFANVLFSSAGRVQVHDVIQDLRQQIVNGASDNQRTP